MQSVAARVNKLPCYFLAINTNPLIATYRTIGLAKAYAIGARLIDPLSCTKDTCKWFEVNTKVNIVHTTKLRTNLFVQAAMTVASVT